MWSLMGDRGMATAFIMIGHSSSRALILTWVTTVILLVTSLFSIILLAKGKLNMVRIGSILLMVLALLSATTIFGLVLGSVLMFFSGVAGIVWTYRRTPHL